MQVVTGLAHVTLKVRDIERTLGFYTGVLNFPEIMRLHHDDGSLFLVYLRITDTVFIELLPGAESDQAPGPDANGVNHFCLTVDDIDVAMDDFIKRGGTPGQWQNGQLVPAPHKVIYDGQDGNRQAWFADPDGNRIELMQMDPNCLQFQGVTALKRA